LHNVPKLRLSLRIRACLSPSCGKGGCLSLPLEQ